jgi:Ca2+-binding RTX toxin-like protein
LRRSALPVVIVAALSIPAAAGAETVRRDGAGGPVIVAAADGESSTLTVSFDDKRTLRLRDTTAPLDAGTGCDGGGPPASVVTCRVSGSPSSAFYLIARLGDDADSIDARNTQQPGVGFLQTDISAGTGSDTIRTGGGLDQVKLDTGDDEAHTGASDDFIKADSKGPDGADLVDGGPGSDEMSYVRRVQDLRLSLDGAANDGAPGEGDRLVSIESLEGGDGDDTILGSPGKDQLYGGNGADLMRGGAGGDYMIDGPKDFFDETTSDRDRLLGGPGSDLMGGGAGPDRVDGARGDDIFVGGGGGNDHVEGGPGRDRVDGSVGDDDLVAGDGNDQLNGGSGDDLVRGGPGSDRVNGGFDSDRIKGGDGDDFLISSYSPVGEVAFHKPDRATDGVGCGTGDDQARVERRDRVGNACEQVEVGR